MGGIENLRIFESTILIFFFVHPHENQSLTYSDFQPKITHDHQLMYVQFETVFEATYWISKSTFFIVGHKLLSFCALLQHSRQA